MSNPHGPGRLWSFRIARTSLSAAKQESGGSWDRPLGPDERRFKTDPKQSCLRRNQLDGIYSSYRLSGADYPSPTYVYPARICSIRLFPVIVRTLISRNLLLRPDNQRGNGAADVHQPHFMDSPLTLANKNFKSFN
jgi:hypothetical protein